MKTEMSSQVHYLYLVHPRDFIRLNEKIYKLGRTEQERGKRIKDYPPDSVGISMEAVSDCRKAEKKLKQEFKKNFTPRREFGTEYFEGDKNFMKEIFRTVCDEFSTKEDQEESDVSDSSTSTENSDTEEEEFEEIMDSVSKKYQRRLLILKINNGFVTKINKVLSSLDYTITGDENDYVSLGNIIKGFTFTFPNLKKQRSKNKFGKFSLEKILKTMIWIEAFRNNKLRHSHSKEDVANIEIFDDNTVYYYPESYRKAIAGIKFSGTNTEYDFSNISNDAEEAAEKQLGCSHNLKEFIEKPIKKAEIKRVMEFIQQRFRPGQIIDVPEIKEYRPALFTTLSKIRDKSGGYGRYISMLACVILGYSFVPHCDWIGKSDNLRSMKIITFFRDDYIQQLVQTKEKTKRDERLRKPCDFHKIKKRSCERCFPFLETSKLKLKCPPLVEEFWLPEEERQIHFLKSITSRSSDVESEKWAWISQATPSLLKKLDFHLKLRGEMEKVHKILSFLIKQFHHRKGIKNPVARKFAGPQFYFKAPVARIYEKCLFFGEDSRWNQPMDSFIFAMSDLFGLTFGKEINTAGGFPDLVYEAHHSKPIEIRHDSFVLEEWVLDESFVVSQQDIIKLQEFKKLMIGVMDRCINLIKKSPKVWDEKIESLKHLAERRNHYNKIFVL